MARRCCADGLEAHQLSLLGKAMESSRLGATDFTLHQNSHSGLDKPNATFAVGHSGPCKDCIAILQQ